MNISLKIKTLFRRLGLYPYSTFMKSGYHIAILRYHSILDGGKNDYVKPNIAMPVDVFERQIQYFSKKYEIVSLDRVAEYYKNQKPLPNKALAITFDDGYRDNYSAYKILKKYGVTGTFYVVAGCVETEEPLWLFEIIYLIKNTSVARIDLEIFGKHLKMPIDNPEKKDTAIRKITEIIKSNNRKCREEIRVQIRSQLLDVTGLRERAARIMLTWDQIREMSDHGMNIGGHTMTHLNLPNADQEEARQEINDCKRVLEEKTQKPVLHFSYPNGGNYDYYNQNVLNMVWEAGYLTSTTSNNGVALLKNDNAFELRRIRVTPHMPEIYYQMEWEPIVDGFRKTLIKRIGLLSK